MGSNILILLPDLCLDLREVILLIVVRNALACILVGIFALRERRIVQLSASGERPEQLPFGLLRWIDAIPKRLAH